MIAGVNRIWIIDHRLVLSKGYRINNNRIGLSVNAVGFEELTIARNTAEYECQKENNTWEHKVIVKGYSDVAADLSNAQKRMNKRYVVAMYLNSGEMIIAGIDTPLRISVKNTSGGAPGEVSGYTLTFGSTSRNSFEFIDKSFFIIPVLVITYGRLYNLLVLTDVKNIATNGWTVPTKADWLSLVTSLGGEAVSGGKLKSIGLNFWNDPNTGATDEVKFNVKGAGLRVAYWIPSMEPPYVKTSYFDSIKEATAFFTLESDSSSEEIIAFYYSSAENTFNWSTKGGGSSVRLIRNASISELELPNGTIVASYIDYEGNSYKSVKIDDKVWMAENLKTEYYSDGTLIPEIQDDYEWVETLSGAWCAFNNDSTLI